MADTTDTTGTATAGRRFGEEGGQLSYGSYLCLTDLLAAQRPQSGGDGTPPAHDELLFITIHQVFELWFKLLLHELEAARAGMISGDAYTPRSRLRRAQVIERVLVEQVDVLETMTPQDFLDFRSLLAPASGFQSVQFREIEFVSGAKDARYLDRLSHARTSERERMRRRLSEPTLWDAYLVLLAGVGFEVADAASRRAALLAVSRDRASHGMLWDLAEALIDHDEMWARWRSRHVLMVERQIGTKSGTGGSTGAPYLRSRLDLRFYPELWELRTHL
ncbi:MAG TPA: tryptophan 2,3-dioxygenase family protein [Mycobacteriales bacterium]|nr:tryptophan 2,3-dioxygenase family protein [Mycobacteriales bacterium]